MPRFLALLTAVALAIGSIGTAGANVRTPADNRCGDRSNDLETPMLRATRGGRSAARRFARKKDVDGSNAQRRGPASWPLPRTYFPTHEENRFQHEGDVARAREYFLTHRPRNLEFLLHKRYDWMNAHLRPGMRVVEFGAGSGLSKEFIRHEGFRISDVEPRPWTDDVADAMAPPYPDGSIDVAIFSHMIHHLTNPARFFASVRRILAPNGLVLIQELNTSFMLKFALRAMRHEGWSYDIDVFDPNVVANDPRDPWSANCAIPELMFRNEDEFERRIPGFRIEKNELNECFVFLASGGVVVRAKTVELPMFALRAIDALDGALVKLMPSVFAMGRSVVLRKIDPE